MRIGTGLLLYFLDSTIVFGRRELGCASAGELMDLEDADCVAIGMKKLEIARLRTFPWESVIKING